MKRRLKGLLAVIPLAAMMLFAAGCNVDVTQWVDQLFCEHAYGEGVVTREATCIEEGELSFTCATCGKVKTEDIEKAEHTSIIVEGKDPTCEDTGLTDGTKCYVCDMVLTAQQSIPAVGHKVVKTDMIAPTCTEDGLTAGETCEKCYAVLLETQRIPAIGHELITIPGYAATCTKDGKTDEIKCKNCDTVYIEAKEMSAYGHTFGEYVVSQAPTCVKEGTKKHTCQKCNLEETESVPATGQHNVVNVNGYPATCTATGLTAGQKCSSCGEFFVEQEVLPKIAHSYNAGEILKAATCSTSGVIRYTCTNCNRSVDETIAATGSHVVKRIEGYAATCTKPGLTSGQKCKVCDIVLTAQEEIPALDHVYDDGVVQKGNNCLVNDMITYTCTQCGATKTDTLETKGNHDIVEGYTCRMNDTCSLCNETLDTFGPHLAGVRANDAASHWMVCNDCGETYNNKAHTFNYLGDLSIDTHNKICYECEYSLSEEHTFIYVPVNEYAHKKDCEKMCDFDENRKTISRCEDKNSDGNCDLCEQAYIALEGENYEEVDVVKGELAVGNIYRIYRPNQENESSFSISGLTCSYNEEYYTDFRFAAEMIGGTANQNEWFGMAWLGWTLDGMKATVTDLYIDIYIEAGTFTISGSDETITIAEDATISGWNGTVKRLVVTE